MACKYYNDCINCINYHPHNKVEESCDKYGLPIGSGDPFCREFVCSMQVCNRSVCISDEELREVYM